MLVGHVCGYAHILALLIASVLGADANLTSIRGARFEGFWLVILPFLPAASYGMACLTYLIIRGCGGEGGFPVAFGYGARAALADGVGVVVGDGLLLLARVEVEHALGVLTGGELAEAHGFVAGRDGVLGLAHLHHGAAAVVRDAYGYDVGLVDVNGEVIHLLLFLFIRNFAAN